MDLHKDYILSTSEVAHYRNVKEQYIRELAKQNKIERTLVQGKVKPVYRYPLSVLSPVQQKAYYADHKIEAAKASLQETTDTSKLDEFTETEREQIEFGLELVAEWQSYRNKDGVKSKAEVDENYLAYCKLEHPDIKITRDILYRKWTAVKNNDLRGLVDNRGKGNKGRNTIDETLWQVFLSFYLDEAQHSIRKCYEYTRMWAQESAPELVVDMPDYTTFYRHIKSDIPKDIEVLGRKGEKAFRDRCAPYIKRVYDGMTSNEWWVADNHTFDIMSTGENGKPHRLYLTAFYDARSGIFTGCHVTTAPSSQATLIALRKGILQYGIPENIYVDNGREFLTFDIGGLGHRKKKTKNGVEPFEPPPIFKRLGINMTNAIVRNARAKIIERRFRDVKEHLSRLFNGYVGGNIMERPERLKQVLKKGDITTDAELTEIVEELLEYYMNQQPYGGAVVKDKGKPRLDVYKENLLTIRKAAADELHLMLMRSTRKQKVTRRGVKLIIAGQALDYINYDFDRKYFGKDVYLRYDPEDLREVRVYDIEDRYIYTSEVDNVTILKYGANKDDIKAAQAAIRGAEKKTKTALEEMLPAFPKPDALELVMAAAKRMKEDTGEYVADAKIIEMHHANEEQVLDKVVNGVELDFKRMFDNAEKEYNLGGNKDE